MGLLVLAVAPSIALFLIFYLRDKYDREPLGLLIKTFLLGAVIVVPVAIIEGVLFTGLGIDVFDPGSLWMSLFAMIFLVALVEELGKYVVVRGYAWGKKAFNEPYDGIMYAVMASLGFATIENILYVFQNGAEIGWLRAFMTVPMHALTAVIMGYYIGLAKYPKVKGKNRYLITGLGIAILFHGGFNFFVSSEVPFLILMAVGLVAYSWIVGIRASKLHAGNSPFKK